MSRILPLPFVLALFGASACAAPPPPSLSPTKAPVNEAARDVESLRQEVDQLLATVPSAAPDRDTVLDGTLSQGGLVFGKAPAGSRVSLDGRDIGVDDEGRFVFGFGRDHGPEAKLTVTRPDGESVTETLPVAPKSWRESRITVAENKANPYSKEDLDLIARDRANKDEARATRATDPFWLGGFVWPTEGCISSPFGSRRIINGDPRRPHSGVDVAAPDGMSPMDYIGTNIYAPAPGYVTLARENMFFEGGMVFIDHGQQLESALMHMSEVMVEEGAFVLQGDLIGKVGMTGRVTGPHLHWSLKWRERLLDPELAVPPRGVCTD